MRGATSIEELSTCSTSKIAGNVGSSLDDGSTGFWSTPRPVLLGIRDDVNDGGAKATAFRAGDQGPDRQRGGGWKRACVRAGGRASERTSVRGLWMCG